MQRIKRNKWIIRYVIVPIIVAAISYSAGKSVCRNQLIIGADNDWIIAGTVNWDVTQNNVKPLSPLELENEKHWQENEAKIVWFFRYWNAEEYSKARNNVGKDISYIFTDENMEKFYKNMSSVFEIKKMEQRGKITNSEFFVATKHDIELSYSYNSQKYIDKLLMVVTRRKEDTKQHHITQMTCEWTNWPFCKYLRWDL